jgi:hypothetical protein
MDQKHEPQTDTVEQIPAAHAHPDAFEAPAQHVQELNEAEHINLSWRSWIVVFVTCFAIMAQVFVVVAAGSVIAFIIRDLGDASIAGWIIRKWQARTRASGTNARRGTTAHAKRFIAHRRPPK